MSDRHVPEVEPPPSYPLAHASLWPNGGESLPDWEVLRDHLLREGRLEKEDCLMLIRRATMLFAAEPNLLRLQDPITTVGDIHGQFFDLVRVLTIGGCPGTVTTARKARFSSPASCGTPPTEPDESSSVSIGGGGRGGGGMGGGGRTPRLGEGGSEISEMLVATPQTQYLFLGDYVDRGAFSTECLFLLYALKICFPTTIWLLRGNHECRQMTTFFNFRDECVFKYDADLYNEFIKSFDCFPLGAILNSKFLLVHGGLSPFMKNQVASIEECHRFREPPRQGLLCDLLWADPCSDESLFASSPKKFFPNEVRGCSYYFTHSAVKNFVESNNLLFIIRAHEAQLEGYKIHSAQLQPPPSAAAVLANKPPLPQSTSVMSANKATDHVQCLPAPGGAAASQQYPTVITIFSAPNYCDCYNNKGAILKFKNNVLNIQQFNFSAHPYYLPNFMDVFTWSIPFVSEKVTEMMYAILHPTLEQCDDDDDQDDDSDGSDSIPKEILKVIRDENFVPAPSSNQHQRITAERADALRNKVVAVGRLCRVLRTLREQHELIVQLKGLTPSHKIPVGALMQGPSGLQSALEQFASAKELDAPNERMPETAEGEEL